MKTGCVLRDVMHKHLVTLDGTASIAEGAKVMASSHVGSLLVTRKGNIVGILTEKDMVRRILAKGKDPGSTALSTICTSPVLTMHTGADVYDAFVFMNREGIRHLPIAEKGSIVGIVTLTDLLKIQPGLMEITYQKGYDSVEEQSVL